MSHPLARTVGRVARGRRLLAATIVITVLVASCGNAATSSSPNPSLASPGATSTPAASASTSATTSAGPPSPAGSAAASGLPSASGDSQSSAVYDLVEN